MSLLCDCHFDSEFAYYNDEMNTNTRKRIRIKKEYLYNININRCREYFDLYHTYKQYRQNENTIQYNVFLENLKMII